MVRFPAGAHIWKSVQDGLWPEAMNKFLRIIGDRISCPLGMPTDNEIHITLVKCGWVKGFYAPTLIENDMESNTVSTDTCFSGDAER